MNIKQVLVTTFMADKQVSVHGSFMTNKQVLVNSTSLIDEQLSEEL